MASQRRHRQFTTVKECDPCILILSLHPLRGATVESNMRLLVLYFPIPPDESVKRAVHCGNPRNYLSSHSPPPLPISGH
ncbi:hypothetical protein HPP92_003696 [Vanilla planifolia]|uniref:Uncharacterized protein n=1 Tax=Vanilla planifolia TaxID=51239 RepID=A0A835S8J9_VANPL|nr:hypothetical protein HPP92_003696 [Vanilla planifolia]